MIKLYIGSLACNATEDHLRNAFNRHGTVDSVRIVSDQETDPPRRFAFVELRDGSDWQKAVATFEAPAALLST